MDRARARSEAIRALLARCDSRWRRRDTPRTTAVGSTISAFDLSSLLTVREAADLLRVKTVTIYRMIKRGELPHMRVANAIRIPRFSLQLPLS